MRSMCFLVVLVASVAYADDTAVGEIGGTAEMLGKGRTSIRMVDEVVRIDRLPKGRVRVRFTFRNEGPAITVRIGFPAMTGGGNPGRTVLGNFHSWVDGKQVRTRYVPAVKTRDESYRAWYVKTVRFGAGQTRIVEDAYEGGYLEDSMGFHGYPYILETGATWKGTIGRARIIVDASGVRHFAPLQFHPSGYAQHGSRISWDYHNYEPGKFSQVRINWFEGFRNIYFNGKPAGYNKKYWGSTYGDIGGPGTKDGHLLKLSKLVGNDSLVPLRLVATWLGGELSVRGKNLFRITLNGNWVDIRAGSRVLTAGSSQKTVAPFASGYLVEPAVKSIRDDGSYVIVVPTHSYAAASISAIVKALGGKASFDAGQTRLNLWLKQ